MSRGRASAAATAAGAVAAALLVAGCGGQPEPKQVPNVAGERLDVAQAILDARGLDHAVTGGGRLGVLVRRRWQVCRQEPPAGKRASGVTLVVARSCDAVPPAGTGAVVPDVEYEPLDEAESELLRAGLGWEVESEGSIVVRSNWEVCDQEPEPGEWGETVELYVERDCWDWD